MTTIITWSGWKILRLSFVISLLQIWRFHFETQKPYFCPCEGSHSDLCELLRTIVLLWGKQIFLWNLLTKCPSEENNPQGTVSSFYLPLMRGKTPLTWVHSTEDLVGMLPAMKSQLIAGMGARLPLEWRDHSPESFMQRVWIHVCWVFALLIVWERMHMLTSTSSFPSHSLYFLLSFIIACSLSHVH